MSHEKKLPTELSVDQSHFQYFECQGVNFKRPAPKVNNQLYNLTMILANCFVKWLTEECVLSLTFSGNDYQWISLSKTTDIPQTEFKPA